MLVWGLYQGPSVKTPKRLNLQNSTAIHVCFQCVQRIISSVSYLLLRTCWHFSFFLLWSLFSFIFSSRHLSLGFKLSLLLVSAKEPRRTMTMKRRREQMRTCLLRRKIKRRKRRRKRRPKQKEREVPASPQEQVRHTRDNSLDTLKTHMYSS